jgi:hypothetical protein
MTVLLTRRLVLWRRGRSSWQTAAESRLASLAMSDDGRSQFDFIFGRWRVHNRKLVDVSDPGCEEWVEFEAVSEALPVLERYGHVDRMYVKDPPDGGSFEGFTLRLFDPASGTWAIWWSSTRAPGTLDPPVQGRFEGDHGVFECEDLIAGRRVVVRFEWLTASKDSPRWQQSFSYDGGETWKLNWVMDLERVATVD